MNRPPIDEAAFEQLWQEAEAGGKARRMAEQYPAWRASRRRTMGIAAVVAVMVAVAVPMMLPSGSIAETQYSKVYCNRPDVAEQQWADLAVELLLS